MLRKPRVIRDYRFEPDKALARRDAVVAAEEAIRGEHEVIEPYFPRRPIPAGDPLSPSGTKVGLSELADDVLATIQSVVWVTADSTAVNGQVVLVDTTTTAVTVTLPAATLNDLISVKWAKGPRANKVTLLAQVGEMIDGATTHIFSRLYTSLTLASDGADWYIL